MEFLINNNDNNNVILVEFLSSLYLIQNNIIVWM